MLRKTALLTAAGLIMPLAAANAQVSTDVQAGATADTQAPAADAGAAAQAQTPAADAAPQAQAQTVAATPANDPVVPATQADFQTGIAVNDPQGANVGTVQSVTADGAVVDTGTNRALLPFASFGKNSAGLVIGLTKTQLDAQVAAASAAAGQQ